VTFVKGKSGNPVGRAVEYATKPFAEALKMEIAAAGNDHKALRKIARNLIAVAQKPDATGLSAASIIADRLDGKPTQESTVNVNRRAPTEMTDAEIAVRIAELRTAAGDVDASERDAEAPLDTSQLN
jgi:hypothetical protein